MVEQLSDHQSFWLEDQFARRLLFLLCVYVVETRLVRGNVFVYARLDSRDRCALVERSQSVSVSAGGRGHFLQIRMDHEIAHRQPEVHGDGSARRVRGRPGQHGLWSHCGPTTPVEGELQRASATRLRRFGEPPAILARWPADPPGPALLRSATQIEGVREPRSERPRAADGGFRSAPLQLAPTSPRLERPHVKIATALPHSWRLRAGTERFLELLEQAVPLTTSSWCWPTHSRRGLT